MKISDLHDFLYNGSRALSDRELKDWEGQRSKAIKYLTHSYAALVLQEKYIARLEKLLDLNTKETLYESD